MAEAACAAEAGAAMGAELAALSRGEALHRQEAALLGGALQEARRSAALAQWRRLQVRTSCHLAAHQLLHGAPLGGRALDLKLMCGPHLV